MPVLDFPNTRAGVRTTDYYGNFNQVAASQLEFALLDSDKTFMVGLQHSSSLSPREFVYLQSAVLYTTVSGQRRVRVCNLALQVVELAMNVFNFADVETVACFAMRKAILQSRKSKMQEVREDLAEQCSSILSGYRYQCAASIAPQQLIIPESLHTLPMLTLGSLKSKPIKGKPDLASYEVELTSR